MFNVGRGKRLILRKKVRHLMDAQTVIAVVALIALVVKIIDVTANKKK
jgi:hypothetical protein